MARLGEMIDDAVEALGTGPAVALLFVIALFFVSLAALLIG